MARFFDNLEVGEYKERAKKKPKSQATVFAPFHFELADGDKWLTFFTDMLGVDGVVAYEVFKRKQTAPAQNDISDGRCFVDDGKFYCEFLKRHFNYRFSVPNAGFASLDLQNLVLVADDADGLDIADARDVRVQGRDLIVFG